MAMCEITHFGLTMKSKKFSFRLRRDEFALINTKSSFSHKLIGIPKEAYANDDGTEYTLEWCKQYRELCLKNYDLNMRYFDSLSKTEFEKVVEGYLSAHSQFDEITDLTVCEGVQGYYIMVLDTYKQVYIGKTSDIKKRIKQHWEKTKPFDRTLFPMYAWNRSAFSIDFFRALDTTRIYIWKKQLSDGIEAELIASFPKKFFANFIFLKP